MYKVLVALFAAPALGALPTCTEYCTSIIQVCNGTNAQFANSVVNTPQLQAMFCGALCSVYPLGTEADVSGDTLGCRAYHLGVAKTASDSGDATNVAVHCPHAGFYGGGLCGAPVDFQCDFMMNNCSYPMTHANCVAEYNKYSTFVADMKNPAFTASLIKPTGATLQCRTANAFNILLPGATQDAKTLACNEGMPVSSACTLDCTDFCTFEGSVCGFGSTGNNQFMDMKACTDACPTWQKLPGNWTQTSVGLTTGDSADCRWYHLGVASTSTDAAATHCPHTKNYPSAYCTDSCSHYCSVIQTACTGELMQFADDAACNAACTSYKSLDAGYTRPVTAGDNLQCRTYHAFVASTNWDLAKTHCVHAGKNSTKDTCGASGNGASSLKVGAATAFLALVGAVSAVLGF